MRGRQSRAEEENTACTSEANLRKVCSLNVHPVPSYVVNRCLTRSSGEVRVLVRVFVLHNILAWVPRTFGQVVVQSLGRVRLFATLWTVAHQAPLSIGFSRPEYWSGLPFPSPGDLPDPGIEPTCPVSRALAGGFFTTVPPGKHTDIYHIFIHSSGIDCFCVSSM